MKIGILQCDEVQEQLQTEHSNYPEMFKALFLAVDSSCTFANYRVMAGEFPDSTDECDAWVITGSRLSVYDELDWITTLKGFVRQLYEDQQKLAGICFGHQLMAEALGGKVTRSEKGWGVGIASNRIVQVKPWMQPSLNSLSLQVSHQDQVTVLPDEAEILAGSDFCPYYMLQYGEHFLSVQGHPEFTKAYARDLMLSRQELIPQQRVEEGLNSLGLETDDQLMTRWMLNFFSLPG